MLIVDAQIHLWNAGNPTTPWHRQIPAYTKADALSEMGAGGVDAAVLTPHTPWDPNANELAMEAARQHPDRFDNLHRGRPRVCPECALSAPARDDDRVTA